MIWELTLYHLILRRELSLQIDWNSILLENWRENLRAQKFHHTEMKKYRVSTHSITKKVKIFFWGCFPESKRNMVTQCSNEIGRTKERLKKAPAKHWGSNRDNGKPLQILIIIPKWKEHRKNICIQICFKYF